MTHMKKLRGMGGVAEGQLSCGVGTKGQDGNTGLLGGHRQRAGSVERGAACGLPLLSCPVSEAGSLSP